MRSTTMLGCAVAALFLFASAAAHACHVLGTVICDQSGLPLPGVRIDFVSTTGDTYSGSITSDLNGQFTIALPIVLACYTATVAPLPGQIPVLPPDGQRSLCITDLNPSYTLDVYVVSDPSCTQTVPVEASSWGALKSAYK